MKLLFCKKCFDVFKLDSGMRSCKCGEVFGRYINNSEAEVSRNAISMAIGNGSLINAIACMEAYQEKTSDLAEREEYYKEEQGLISHAWVRPNQGKGNPHCKVLPPSNPNK